MYLDCLSSVVMLLCSIGNSLSAKTENTCSLKRGFNGFTVLENSDNTANGVSNEDSQCVTSEIRGCPSVTRDLPRDFRDGNPKSRPKRKKVKLKGSKRQRKREKRKKQAKRKKERIAKKMNGKIRGRLEVREKG